MNAHTGGAIDRLAHIRQSIADILTTRIGTRVMRREYGSQLPELIDAPFNDTTRLHRYDDRRTEELRMVTPTHV
ncbi:GPW/gp25 family protein, partial [Pseudomonas aeruginosa]|uniref:GPW/gp25 family protein n=1 Tax=Pseudomonas aeruginosa TaxID=287 RepID=UPI0031B67FB4